jgi:hypothetical protein
MARAKILAYFAQKRGRELTSESAPLPTFARVLRFVPTLIIPEGIDEKA